MKYIALIFWMVFTVILGITILPLIIASEYDWFDVPEKILKSK